MSDSPAPLYCYNHPAVETGLRCTNCNRPICPRCVVRTPTGYRCKECVRAQQKVFDTAIWIDYPLAVIIAGILSFFGSLLAGLLGFFTIFLAPVAGVVIAEIVRFAIRRRRGRLLFQLAAAAAAVGSLPVAIGLLLGGVLGGGDLFFWLPLLWQGVYTFIITSTIYYRLRGINIR